jgi:IS605 OrfB family transposase
MLHNWKHLVKLKRQQTLSNFGNVINKFRNNIWCPSIHINYTSNNPDSWFDISEYKSSHTNVCIFKPIKFKFTQPIKAIQVELLLTSDQKNIINKWFDAYAKMYNETLYFIKKSYFETNKLNINYKNLRTYHLKNIRNNIVNGSEYNGLKYTRIFVHTLDQAIKLACSNYKSGLSNFKNGNIKQFRIRYWRKNRKTKVIDIEKQSISKKGICWKILGDIKTLYNGKEFNFANVSSDCKIQYNSNTNKYILFVPIKLNHIENNKLHDIISLDPGIRVFMTGLSENESIKICTNSSERISKYLKIIDKVKSDNLPKKIIKKYEKRYNNKIKNLVNDLHWKTIRYLTSKYKNILIGDLSVKGITNRETSKITPMIKRIAYRLKFYEFRQRLEYKCNLYKINYKVVDEVFTSKVCSLCGIENKRLGSSKIFNCSNCRNIIDRDTNGCRGIFLKQYM